MSLFRRKDEPGAAGGGEGASTSVAASRDPDLAVPPFRPSGVTLPTPQGGPMAPKPNSPPATAGVTRVPSAPAAAPSAPATTAAPPSRGPARTEVSDRRTLVVGKGISLQGTVTEAERLVIEGTMESQLLQAQELIIGHSGVFKGEAQVEDAEIAGTFDGVLNASGSLTIRATGRVIGTARSRRLSVEDGGQLSGKMEMMSDTPAASANTPRLAPAPTPARSTEPADA